MKYLFILAKFSYIYGLIGIDEFQERIQVARWLDSDNAIVADPRIPVAESEGVENKLETGNELLKVYLKSEPDDHVRLEIHFLFRANGRWYFTISDPDPYPSTPHGHLNSKNLAWPKPNPYTGRVFKAKHEEHKSMRLSKPEMRQLWRNCDFRKFFEHHILWYMENFPQHEFAVRYPLRFPKW